MIIEKVGDQYHVVKAGVVYGSFLSQSEADAFLIDLAADRVFLGTTADERQQNIARLKTIEQIRNGETVQPVEPGEFKFLGTDPMPGEVAPVTDDPYDRPGLTDTGFSIKDQADL